MFMKTVNLIGCGNYSNRNRQTKMKQTEVQNKTNDLRELFENGRNEEEKYFTLLQKDNKSSTVAKILFKLRDLCKYNGNKIKELLSYLSNM